MAIHKAVGGLTRADGSSSEAIAVAFATDQINTRYPVAAHSLQCMNTSYAANDNEVSRMAA
jgi:hypothetical protein